MNCLLNRHAPRIANVSDSTPRKGAHTLATLVSFAVLAVAVGFVPGCRAADPVGVPLELPSDPADIWQPVAETARIHPGTRFVLDGDRAFLQLGLELLDGLGDPVKSPGMMECQLLTEPDSDSPTGLRGGQAARTSAGEQGVRLYGWTVRVATLEEQRQHWDPIALSYLFELDLDSFAVASRPCRVRVEFQAPGRRPLVAEAVMQTLSADERP